MVLETLVQEVEAGRSTVPPHTSSYLVAVGRYSLRDWSSLLTQSSGDTLTGMPRAVSPRIF